MTCSDVFPASGLKQRYTMADTRMRFYSFDTWIIQYKKHIL